MLSFLLLGVIGLMGVSTKPVRKQLDDYDYYCVGRCSFPVNTSPQPGYLLMGGGADVNSAFVWWLEKANGGDVVVLRASGDGAYNQYLYALGDVNSVSTIVFNRASAAEDPFVLDIIAGAEAIFMAGGDQWDYMSFWRNSTVQQLLNNLLNVKRGPIGGTSAGLAVLGEYVYTAEDGSVISEEALENPYHRFIGDGISGDSLVDISLLETAITDSHFRDRDRMGRLMAFMARVMEDFNEPVVRGIAVSEASAVCIEGDGSSRLLGRGEAYILQSTTRPAVCEPGTPLTFRDVTVYKLVEGRGTYDFDIWRGSGGTSYNISAVDGVLRSTQSGNQIY